MTLPRTSKGMKCRTTARLLDRTHAYDPMNHHWVNHPGFRFDSDSVSTETLNLNHLVKNLKPLSNGTAIHASNTEGQSFDTVLVCAERRTTSEALQLEPRLTRTSRVCPKCKSQMVALGFFESEDLLLPDLSCEQRDLPLASVGILPGDILRVGFVDSEDK